MRQQAAKSNLGQIREELKRRLIVLRYSKISSDAYMRIYGWIEEYLKSYGEENYSAEWGQRFIRDYSLQSTHSASQYKHAQTVVRRLNEIIENKLFAPCFRKSLIECPSRFISLHEKYLTHLARKGYRKSTINSQKRYSALFLSRIPDIIKEIKNLTAADLYGIFTKHEWVGVCYVAAKSLLLFLYESGVTKADLSVCVPKSRRLRSLPSVYTGDEVTRLLSSVDRTTILGKRDYAILMLAAHLGLRSSDIVNLSLKDINYTAKTIEVIQVKTERPLTLVMNGDVEEAITDYIQNGRPQSKSEKVFLGARAPFAPITAGLGYVIVHKYFKLAGVAGLGRKRGTHALRTSYATALVAKGTPYTVVQEALGHEDPESAKYYVRVDVRRLRACALEVPKPTGAFAVILGDLEGVL